MLTQHAKQGIEYLFIRSAKANLVINPDDRCDVVQAMESDVRKSPEKNILVLTISSFLFRLLTIFHINESASAISYFGMNASAENFADIFAEHGNMCCGAINRELADYFPYLGMSTPYMLSSECVSFLREMNPEFLCDYIISINESIRVRATLCMKVYGTVDFSVNTSAVAAPTGELELF